MSRERAFPKPIVLVLVVLIGIVLGQILFGMIVHEESHAVACIIFGVKIESWSLDHVTYLASPNETVNILVQLAGGFGQALFSFIFFIYTYYYFERRFAANSICKVFETGKFQILPSLVFGFELAFLAIVFQGIVSGIVEGFLFSFYSQNYDNLLVWLPLLALCIALAFGVLYPLQGKYLKL